MPSVGNISSIAQRFEESTLDGMEQQQQLGDTG